MAMGRFLRICTLPTIANNMADNFILLIIDNGSYGSTGDQPIYGEKTSLFSRTGLRLRKRR